MINLSTISFWGKSLVFWLGLKAFLALMIAITLPLLRKYAKINSPYWLHPFFGVLAFILGVLHVALILPRYF